MPRPKSFDPDTVLAKAMGVFWEKGFDAASISDLTDAMGINRFSLYDTFGDKHQLYLQALDAYNQRVVEPMITKIAAINTLASLEAYFSMIIEYQHTCTGSPCCLMHKAAVSLVAVDEQAKQRIEQVRARFQEAFLQALQRIKSAGELKPDLDLNATAWLLKITQAGLATYGSSPIAEPDAKAAISTLIEQIRA
ncbi:TetR family transcriptional regulator [bacterium]|nr:MAG: TetR family transcriptional regulator [bacterium]